ncbi:MAG TPA: enoyl-CoA hydratase-related protein [Cytophagaceae bacterium]|jgi:2-(1,2-epoxy-1,2-dihydrophenyl)acetyl-CoA isomerase
MTEDPVFNCLTLKKENGVNTITLNRPEVYNSLNRELLEELLTAFILCREDDCRVILLTGNGKGFCAGQDLKILDSDTPILPSEIIEKLYNPLIYEMRNLAKPVLCKLNGFAVGAGCSLALACDMIIASENAVLSEAFIGIGLVPDSGSSFFLPRLVGTLKAFELFALGSKISAQEALSLGMVNYVVLEAELDHFTERYIQLLLAAPAVSLGLIKSMINQSVHSDLPTMLALEARYQDMAAETADFKEGVTAFLEKRKPTFNKANPTKNL